MAGASETTQTAFEGMKAQAILSETSLPSTGILRRVIPSCHGDRNGSVY
jgi:hypothetical protein